MITLGMVSDPPPGPLIAAISSSDPTRAMTLAESGRSSGDEVDERTKSLADDERLVDPDQAKGPAFCEEVPGFGE